MSPFHVLVDELDGKHKVQVKCVDDVRNHADAHRQRCVFKVCQLDIHRSEFNAPSNVGIISGRIFES